MIRACFCLLLLLGVAACEPPATGPQAAAPPYPIDDDARQTPNSLPPTVTTSSPSAPETDVVGVTHLPP